MIVSKTKAGQTTRTKFLEQEVGQLERPAVDGKVLLGSGRSDGKPLLALISAVTHHLRTTIKSVPIAGKSNEPTEGR